MKLTEDCNAFAGQEAVIVMWVPIEEEK